MGQLIQQNLGQTQPAGRERAVKILAKSIYKELRQNGYDPKQKRRLFDTLNSQGSQANQDVTFLTDGG